MCSQGQAYYSYYSYVILVDVESYHEISMCTSIVILDTDHHLSY